MSASSSKYPSKLVVDNDKELPDAPPMLTPLRKHQPSPFFNRSRWSRELSFTQQPAAKPSEGRLRWVFTLPALVISLLVFAIATILLLYLVTLRQASVSDGSAIFVSELATNTLLGLTISTVATHTVSISVPFLVSIAAYCVAGKWLKEQEFPSQTRVALPTPLQYAFMVKMLATSNVIPVFQAGRYMRASRGRIRTPRTFHLALALTSLILGLSYSLILADVWLHGASSVVEETFTTAVRSVSFGVAFNDSVCTTKPCLNSTAGWAANAPWITQAGLLVATNSSTALSVMTISNASDLAIVVPASATINASQSFDAPSFGVRAQCASFTANCTSSAALQAGCPASSQVPLALGSNSTASTNRTTQSASNASSSSTVQDGTKMVPTAGTTANPQNVVLRLQWSSNGTIRPANPTAIQTNTGNILAWASCDLMFYNLTIRYQDGNYSTVGAPVLATPSFANLMQGALISQLGNLQLASNLQATMLAAQNESSALAAMNQELGRLSLALFAGALQPITTAAEGAAQASARFGRYPLAPVVVYLFLLYAYAFAAGGIYLWAARLRAPLFRAPERKTTSAVQLAQLRLTDPLALVATIYPSYPDSPAPEDPRDLFLEDETTSRLEIGTNDGVNAQPVFGVYRRVGPWSAEVLEMG
ncbi:hypothetical protein C8R44DRAFT_868114 [Mycena epipterygia]|nr:hypothetical protein C8R44DRAFT_868114 [Mycena epipterygia]